MPDSPTTDMAPAPAARPAAHANWPLPADTAAAGRLAERFAALNPTSAALAAAATGAAVLACLGGNSPYLADLALREPDCLAATLSDGPDATLAAIVAVLQAVPPTSRRAALAAALRRAKRRAALTIALADLGGVWALDQVVAALSHLAGATLRLAVDHLLLEAAGRGELHVADPRRASAGSGFVVLGMGKLGAGELNYSSDIDLVLVYDPAPHIRAGGDTLELPACFARIARGLVALMQQRDADGYVFRTDLRLRPDPGATPPAISLPAAMIYYESLAQNWERAAMVKARPVAGDIDAGDAFLAAIRPFIWRRGLDFAAVADIGGMKQRIDAHRNTHAHKNIGTSSAAVGVTGSAIAQIAGFDLKLGRGGIREIEFLTQTLQLIWGGRDPALRDNTTLGALAALMRAGHLAAVAAEELALAYRMLRGLEHRVQMVADRQTHRLPATLPELERFAIFAGDPDAAALADRLLAHLRQVRARYAEVFERAPDGDAMLDFTGPDPPPATLERLAASGFTQPAAIVAAVQGWRSGRIRALRSERARDLINQMLPALLAALARQPQPDVAFGRFDVFLSRLPAGVQLLSLMQHNPALLDRIAAVLGAAPWLADHLARVPQALEGLIAPNRSPPPDRLLAERLADARAIDEVIEITRRSVHEVDFALSVDTLERRLDVDAAGLARADLADAAIRALMPCVLADVARRFGTVPGGGVAIVALGKAGSREMMAGSDLDLMLIYDHPPAVTDSVVAEGAPGRPAPVTQYYSRVAQSFIGALTAPGAEGPLYAVDMRLRPSGNAGPVAVSLAGFAEYHRTHSWTWERMALTRARVVAAPPDLAARVAAAIRTVILRPAAPATLRHDAAAMRARLARDLPATHVWDVKHRTGGLMEVEFIAQLLQLIHAATHPAILEPTTRIALHRLAHAGLLAAADAAALIAADHLWRTVQSMLRVTVGKATDRLLPAASAEALLAACAIPDTADQAALHRRLDDTGATVRALFVRLVGSPDPALLEKPT